MKKVILGLYDGVRQFWFVLLLLLILYPFLFSVLKILVETSEDRMMVLQRSGLSMLHEAFNTIYLMHHEATACHVASDLVDILHIILDMLKPLKNALSERKGRLKALKKALSERKGRLKALKNALSERKGGLKALKNALSERKGKQSLQQLTC